MFGRTLHPGKFKVKCPNPRCSRRKVYTDGYIEERPGRMVHHRTETFSAMKLMLLRTLNAEYEQIEEGTHHTYYCPNCFRVKTIVEWKGGIIQVYTDRFE